MVSPQNLTWKGFVLPTLHAPAFLRCLAPCDRDFHFKRQSRFDYEQDWVHDCPQTQHAACFFIGRGVLVEVRGDGYWHMGFYAGTTSIIVRGFDELQHFVGYLSGTFQALSTFRTSALTRNSRSISNIYAQQAYSFNAKHCDLLI